MSARDSSALLFVLSGPCGVGKTTLTEAWLRHDPDLHYVDSITTRQPPPGLQAKEKYEVVSREKFVRLIEDDQLAEWVNPFDTEFWGTLRKPVDDAIEESKDLVFDYSPEGYMHLRSNYPERTVGIFIMARDVETMIGRLRSRGTETPVELEMRHQMALRDFNFVGEHEYHVVNDELASAVATLSAIRAAEKAKTTRQGAAVRGYSRWAKRARLRYYCSP